MGRSLTDDATTSFPIFEIFSPILSLAGMISDGDVDMVKDVVGVGLVVISGDDTSVLWVGFLVDIATHWETSSAILVFSTLVGQNLVTPSHL